MSPRRAAVLRTHPAEHAASLRDHLVAATERLLEHHSLGELTTRAIAHHAHVSDGVLYNHFADKADLVMAALLSRYGKLVERLEAAAPEAGQGTVVGNVQAYGRALSDVEADLLLHGAGLVAHPPLLHRFWAEIHRSPFGIDRLRRPIVDYLAAEQRRGRVGAELDIEAAVTVVFGASAMAALSRHLNPTADPAGFVRHLDASLGAAVSGFGATVNDKVAVDEASGSGS
jgi:AcrR family transcriptional regulator